MFPLQKTYRSGLYTTLEDGKPIQEGYCLTCARELHIKPVDDLMQRFGMSDQDLENMEERMASFLEEAGQSGAMMPADAEGEEEFIPGGSPAFPFGLRADAQDADRKKPGKKDKAPRRKFLDTYCENLTQKAKDGRIDRIVGRDREIYRTLQILCRRQKNNPCLIGEAGVGKTAIAEGIAQRIAEGKVPARLQDKEIYLLDLTALVAGTQFRGQFEQRVKGLLSEIKAAGNVILFIDEIHNLVGAGDSDGAMNAANIMKPALSRGQVQVIGATTFSEYRKYIEKDSALERRFQPVKVEEPSINDSIEVLRGVKVYYEKHHCVRVPDPIVASVVQLSERYITDRYLPDKAIDLLDEACASCNLRHPEITEFFQLQRRIAELEEQEHTLENPDPENPMPPSTMRSSPKSRPNWPASGKSCPRSSCASPISRSRWTTSPRSSNSGLASPPSRSRRASTAACRGWRTRSRRTSSARTRRCTASPWPSSAPGPTFPAATARPASSLLGPPASARPSWSSSWRASCSIPSIR